MGVNVSGSRPMIRYICLDQEICRVDGISVQLPTPASSWASSSWRCVSTCWVTSVTRVKIPTTSPSTS